MSQLEIKVKPDEEKPKQGSENWFWTIVLVLGLFALAFGAMNDEHGGRDRGSDYRNSDQYRE